MKNYQVEQMLKAITEVAEFKSKSLPFVQDFLKAKRALIAKAEELQETMKAIVELTEEEKEVAKKAQSKAFAPNKKEQKLLDVVKEKDVLYSTKYNELMLDDCEVDLPKIDMDNFPEGTLIKHFDALEPMIK